MDKPAAGNSVPARLGLLACLYFCQGLPFGFFTQSLPVLLRERGFSLGAIGLSSLLALPWALKFLWAPAVDRHGSRRLGRRRSWILPLQLATVAVLVVLAAATPVSMNGLMAAVLLLNLLAATQDIATDGLAVDLLTARERGLGNGLQVAGYRVGMIVGGGGLLILQAQLAPAATFLVMAALTAAATAPILFTREPHAQGEVTGPGTTAHFLRRPGAARLLLLIVAYKAGDAFAIGMLRPFLADAGLGLAQIGWLIGTVGFVAGLLGALVGGTLINRIGRRSALISFGLLQAGAVAGYAALAIGRPSLGALYLLCAFEHLASGMATAALFTCLMDWCAPRTGATDYTVQASAVVVATGAASALSGFSAQALGYLGHFSLASILAVAGVAAAWRLFPAARPSRTAGASAVVSCG